MTQKIVLKEHKKAHKTMTIRDMLFYRRMGKGYPLVLLHGAMVSGEMFSFNSVAAELSKNYDVIIPDLRGHGKSKNMPSPYTTAQCAEDIKRLLDALDIKSAYILGYSYGGMVAQQVAYKYPTLVNKLILSCTVSYTKLTLKDKIEIIILSFALRLLGAPRLVYLRMKFNPEFNNEPVLKKGMQKMFADNNTKTALAVLKEVVAFDSRAWAHHIHCPTLIIGGSADQSTPMYHAHSLHDNIKDSQIEIFEDASHTLLWTHSKKFVSVVRIFLK